MSYEQFVTNYRRYTTTSTTLGEAFRDSTYATAMWKCETPNQRAGRMLADVSIGLGTFLIPFLIFCYGFYTWVAK